MGAGYFGGPTFLVLAEVSLVPPSENIPWVGVLDHFFFSIMPTRATGLVASPALDMNRDCSHSNLIMYATFNIPNENIMRQGMTYFSTALETKLLVEKVDDSVSV